MKIDNYAIIARKRYAAGYYFVDGYKTLQTMRKRWNKAINYVSGKPHDPMLLVARDYNGNIIRIYEQEVYNA